MQEGTIKKLIDRGFGFIAPEGQEEKDLFFHFSDLEGVKFEHLRQGEKVTYEIGNGRKGDKAIKVQRVEE